jgi:hypothetical protein
VFHWSDTRFPRDFESGLDHHEGLEIVSFILNGSTSHYDGVSGQWVDLHAGDAEIIRSGSGIAHSELAAAGARVLSIWFDPGYDAALRRRPSYADYPAALFTARPIGDALVTDLIEQHLGPGGVVLAERLVGKPREVHEQAEHCLVRRQPRGDPGEGTIEQDVERPLVRKMINRRHGQAPGRKADAIRARHRNGVPEDAVGGKRIYACEPAPGW